MDCIYGHQSALHCLTFTHTFIVSAMQGGIVYYKKYISLYTKMYTITFCIK